MSLLVFQEYQKNFKNDVQANDYKLLLETNNLIISLLRHLIKKNKVGDFESIIIRGIRVEICLDISGFEKELIDESLHEISYLGNFEITDIEYHIGLLGVDIYDEKNDILKLDMFTDVFISLRNELLNIQSTTYKNIEKPTNQLALFN